MVILLKLDKKMYFYLSDSGQLIIRVYGFDEEGRLITEKTEKEATACDIKTIYGRTAVWVKSLALGYPYLELPAEVAGSFEEVLRDGSYAVGHHHIVFNNLLPI